MDNMQAARPVGPISVEMSNNIDRLAELRERIRDVRRRLRGSLGDAPSASVAQALASSTTPANAPSIRDHVSRQDQLISDIECLVDSISASL